ncbi:MAG: hypothetical protein WAS33_30920 [Candidatus Promineifilaceae bacterium]|nr:hypothetical protein [Anaerolineaceae bacterium]
MNNWIILGVQSTIGLIVYALVFFWYVQPALSKLSFERAVAPMLLLHVFRFTGLTLLVIGQVDPSVPQAALSAIAYGDLLAGMSALLAVLALRGRSALAVPLIWLFTIIGFADLVNVGRIAVNLDLFNHAVGVMWLVAIWYFPTILIAHVYIVYRLINKGNSDLKTSATRA